MEMEYLVCTYSWVCLFPSISKKDSGGLITNYILYKNCHNNTEKQAVSYKINALAYVQAFKVDRIFA